MEIKISQLRTDGLQMRVSMNETAIAEYAELMAGGTVFPPVTVFRDAANAYWLADGFHRVEAAKREGRKTVTADVRKGEWIDALRYALHANSGHGMRMTNADKRHALEVAWAERERLFGGEPSHSFLAEVCGVSLALARRFREEQVCSKSNPAAMPTRPGRYAQRATLPQRAETEQVCSKSNPAEAEGEPTESAQLEENAPPPPVMPVRRIGRDGKAYSVPARTDAPVRRMPRDRYGVEIPVEINAAFEGSPLADILSCVSKARTALRKGIEAHDPAFGAVRQDALVNLNNAYSFISAAKPHCVCRMCQGTGCRACHGRGWQTEEEYKRNPKEFQAE